MTTFVPRATWGAKQRKQGTTSIIDHPSVTYHYVGGGWEFPWNHSSCDDKVRGIQEDHMLPEDQGGRGWSDIAYNYLVCPHDYVYEGRGFDRRSSANGNEQANNSSFAVCALWGTASADDPLPEGLKRAFMYARGILITRGGATEVIKGHRDWKSTDCPGDQIYAWIKAGCPLPPVGEPDMTTDASVRKIFKEELAASVEDGGALHELVQSYAAFNALHVDQIEATTAGDVDNALSNDFTSLNQRVSDLTGTVASLADLVRDLINKS